MKTCIRYLEAGAVEVIRLISPDDLEHFAKDDPLLYEKSIVWLEDVDFLPFVRVKMVQGVRSRRGPLSFGKGFRVLGYSKLTPDAPRCAATHGYQRRVFYLKPDDTTDPDAVPPSTSYDPKTILPGIAGRQYGDVAHHSSC